MNSWDLYGGQPFPASFRWESHDMGERREFRRLVMVTLFWAGIAMVSVVAALAGIPELLSVSELIG